MHLTKFACNSPTTTLKCLDENNTQLLGRTGRRGQPLSSVVFSIFLGKYEKPEQTARHLNIWGRMGLSVKISANLASKLV